MKTNKTNSAKSAKANKAKNSAKKVKTIEATTAAVVCLPIAIETETETGKTEKVTSREVLKAAGSLRAAVKEERRGANCTIRLIAERAANGDASAVDVLCALCDVPRSALFSLNIDTVRAAVNAHYPYFVEVEGRKVSVKAAGVWYS